MSTGSWSSADPSTLLVYRRITTPELNAVSSQ
jgi:hypothetical protein